MRERPCTYRAEAAARRREAARQGTATYEQRMWRASVTILCASAAAVIFLIVVVAVWGDGGPWNLA